MSESEQSSGTDAERWQKPVKGELITFDQLKQICPTISPKAEVFLPHLNDTLVRFEITTKPRIAAFIANVAHESGSFFYVREIWGPSSQQKRYERDFKAAWPPTAKDMTNALAFSLGNEYRGDGMLFKGRALLQTTGRANYRAVGKALGEDFVKYPQLLETPQYACLTAGWYWDSHKLNQWADKPKGWTTIIEFHGKAKTVTGIVMIRKIINGGFNGINEVQIFYDRAMDVL